MGKIISDKSKLAQGRCTGHGANYKPGILIREVRNKGTASNLIDWKHHRPLQLLSQGELWVYVLLRWREDTADIREQFFLDKEKITSISKKLGYRVPKGLLTTDLLVTKSDGTLVAYSVKDKHSELNNNRVVFRQLIEKTYWDEENVEFHIVYKEDLDRTVCENILSCIRFYDIETVSERIGLVKHLIARKKIKVDLKEKINFEKLADIYIGKGMIHG